MRMEREETGKWRRSKKGDGGGVRGENGERRDGEMKREEVEKMDERQMKQ